MRERQLARACRVWTSIRRVRLSERTIVIAAAAILTVYYALGTLHNQGRPGARALDPRGWWGWFDQGRYLTSARALARLDLRPDRHWYPLGYPLLGAPFTAMLPRHPFLLVDLGCLLAAFGGFVVFARGCGITTIAAVAAFLLGAIGSESVRQNWVIPWTTTPVAAMIWLFLASCIRHLDAPVGESPVVRRRRLVGAGLLVGLVPLFRPADLLLPAIGVMLMGWWSLRDRTLRPADPLMLSLGAALPVVPYALLHLRIYGLHPTGYMLASRSIGFRFDQLPMKTVLLLITPRPWFPSGSGLLMRLPWMAAGFAGMLLLPGLRGTARRGLTMLTAMMLAYMALFFSYVDLLPSGLWTYQNVHYFKWLLPGFALLGVVFLRALLHGPRRTAVLALAAVVLASAVRLIPVPVAEGAEARLLQYPGTPPDWRAAYMGHAALGDAAGVFQNIRTMRVLPDGQGLRVLSLSRPFRGHLVWLDRTGLDIRPDRPPKAWGMRVALGWPCWLPPYACNALDPLR